VSGHVKPGTNEISVEVSNPNGPPALWLSLKAGEFILNTGENWQASFAGAVWQPARLASKPAPIRKGSALYSEQTPIRSLLARLPLLLVFLAFAMCLLLAVRWWAAP